MTGNQRVTRGWALPATILVVLATGCGTTLPDRSFDALGSGKPIITSQSPGIAGSGPASDAQPGPAPGSGPAALGSQGTQGSAGTQGTSGHTVTTGGQHGGTTPAGQAPASCGGGTSQDPGVTPTSVKVGIIYTGTNNPFAPNQFVVSYYGVRSYLSYLDQQGGICGRQVQLVGCDDGGDRNRDVECARRLIDVDKVFALVGNNVFSYSGAQYVDQQGVPDIGGQPVTGTAYFTYPHLYSIQGSYYANRGTPPSAYWGQTGLGQLFRKQLGVSRAAVVAYAQTDSQRGAAFIKGWLQGVGIHVDTETVPLAGDPTPQIADAKQKGDQALFDTLDINGNLKVCRAMQQNSYSVPVVATISTWTQETGKDLGGYPCLNNYYSWGHSTNYADTSNAQARLFRRVYASYAPGAPVSQWSLEGWAAAMWFADAAKSCGRGLTRACVEKYVGSKRGYSAHGLLDPHTTVFPRYASKPATLNQCYTVVKWQGGPSGTWSTVVDHKNGCYRTSVFTYQTG